MQSSSVDSKGKIKHFNKFYYYLEVDDFMFCDLYLDEYVIGPPIEF